MNTTLILELTNLCNLNCTMCELPQRDVKKGFISLSLVKKILKDLKKDGLHFDLLLPFWAGESTLHPEFKEIISLIFEYNKEHDIADGLGIDTNLSAMQKDDIDFLLSADQFVVMHLSIDAIKEQTYKKIRTGGDFNKVMENALYLLKKRNESGSKYPHLVFQIIVMKENFDELFDFVDYWSKILHESGNEFQINYFYDLPEPITKDTIFIRRCDAPVNENELQIKYDSMHSKIVKDLFGIETGIITNEFREDEDGKNIYTGDNKRKICAGPFTHLSIKFDGRVTLCCQDTEAELNIGNVNFNSISDIWYGPNAEKLCWGHISGELPDKCRNCFNQIYPLINKEECYKLMKRFDRKREK